MDHLELVLMCRQWPGGASLAVWYIVRISATLFDLIGVGLCVWGILSCRVIVSKPYAGSGSSLGISVVKAGAISEGYHIAYWAWVCRGQGGAFSVSGGGGKYPQVVPGAMVCTSGLVKDDEYIICISYCMHCIHVVGS